jgi:hypothetical protein
LLPDGTVLLISGESNDVDQNEFAGTDVGNAAPSDPRHPQIFDPETLAVSTELPPSGELDVFRGYHNTASLLHDGRVLVGGGFNQFGDVGCENDNVRVFAPSYLSGGGRPAISGNLVDPLVFFAGARGVAINYDGSELHPYKGVALLAVQAFTHSYGQNQVRGHHAF